MYVMSVAMSQRRRRRRLRGQKGVEGGGGGEEGKGEKLYVLPSDKLNYVSADTNRRLKGGFNAFFFFKLYIFISFKFSYSYLFILYMTLLL